VDTPQKKVLLLSLSGIGNFLMQSPVFAALKAAYPGWRLTVWVAPRGTKTLAENNPHIDAVIEAPIKQSLQQHLNLVNKLRKQRFDIGIVLYPGQLVKSALYLYLAGIPKRIGHKYPLNNNPSSSFSLTSAVDKTEGVHDIEQNLRLLESLAIKNGTQKTRYYSLIAPQKNQQEAEKLLRDLSIPASKKIIGLHVGSATNFVWKRWPLQYFSELGRVLTEKYNTHLLLFGGPEEKELNEKLLQELSGSATIIAAPLLTTAAVIQKCQLFVSNDSGLMHIAAATGVPTLGIFGPTDEHRTGPRGPQSFTMRAPSTKPIYDTDKNYKLGTQSHPTLIALKPAAVIKKVLDVIEL
jgi:heptosyltransferase-2